MTFTIQYHQVYQGRYITKTATTQQESLEDVLQLMFHCVPGLRWVRYQGKNYGKPKNPSRAAILRGRPGDGVHG